MHVAVASSSNPQIKRRSPRCASILRVSFACTGAGVRSTTSARSARVLAARDCKPPLANTTTYAPRGSREGSASAATRSKEAAGGQADADATPWIWIGLFHSSQRATRFTRAPLCGRVTSRRSVTQRNARPVTASPLTSAAGPARRMPTAEPRSATSPPLAGKYRCTVHTWRAQLGLDFPLAHKKLQRTPSTSYPSGAHALWRRPGPSVSESGRHRGRCGWVLELFQSRVLSWWWAPREVAFRVSLPLLPRR